MTVHTLDDGTLMTEEGEWIGQVGNGSSSETRSTEQKQLFSALAKAQAMMTGARKDAVNPHFKSKYADLAAVWEAIREPLTSNGLSLIQEPLACRDGIMLRTTLAHESGEWRSSVFYMPATKHDAHGYGSALTYARRYAAMGVGICPEDDDGNASISKTQQAKQDAYLTHQAAVREHLDSVTCIKDALAEGDYEKACEAYYELDKDTQIALNLAPSKGGIFTTEERAALKSDQWAAARAIFFESAGEHASGDTD